MVKKWIPAHFIMGIAAMLAVFGLDVSSAEAASLRSEERRVGKECRL